MLLSGAWGKVIHEKNLKQKISWHCPFKQISFLREWVSSATVTWMMKELLENNAAHSDLTQVNNIDIPAHTF